MLISCLATEEEEEEQEGGHTMMTIGTVTGNELNLIGINSI